MKYNKLSLNLKKATPSETGSFLQTPLDTALRKLLQLTLSRVRYWGSWIHDVGDAFQPQILHNFKLQLGNTEVFLSQEIYASHT